MSHFAMADGRITYTYTSAELEFLGDVLPLLESIGTLEDDPAGQRLNVPVYLNDPESNEEWWRLMGSELNAGRQADRGTYQSMLSEGSGSLDVEEGNAVLRVLNEARLVLGARFGIDTEDDHDQISDDRRQILDYLGWIQEELTVELFKTL